MNEATPSPESTNAAEGHAPADVAYPKTIKSFVRRAGRTTT
ncbi:MAG TPA: tRNA (guanosine(46)-N7)-methyltransferase TrmB, partial [Burkholderiaceae bacterium]|nr:tRNA (guanosine(46)-N7)-methyltransferase TrmB [Burkholderiaceae bacterium]